MFNFDFDLHLNFWIFLRVTSIARSRLLSPCHFLISLRKFFSYFLFVSFLTIPPFGAPLDLILLVIDLVSILHNPGIPFFLSHASKCCIDLKLDGSEISQLIIIPYAKEIDDSLSWKFVPTFPIWGNVKLIIWPA